MENNQRLKILAAKLYLVVRTPVTTKILEKITDKQIKMLSMMIENILTPHENAFYYKSEEESRKVILSILDYGKSKIKPPVYSDKTINYLKAKNII